MIRNPTDPIGTNNGDPALHIDTKLNLKNLKKVKSLTNTGMFMLKSRC